MTASWIEDVVGETRLATDRNDRPLRPNSIIFGFKVREVPKVVGTLLLQGPRGFVFDEDCLSGSRKRPGRFS